MLVLLVDADQHVAATGLTHFAQYTEGTTSPIS